MKEAFEEVMDTSLKRNSDCIEKQTVEVTVSHVTKKILELIMDSSQERISVRVGEQTVDVPLSHITQEIREMIVVPRVIRNLNLPFLRIAVLSVQQDRPSW